MARTRSSKSAVYKALGVLRQDEKARVAYRAPSESRFCRTIDVWEAVQ